MSAKPASTYDVVEHITTAVGGRFWPLVWVSGSGMVVLAVLATLPFWLPRPGESYALYLGDFGVAILGMLALMLALPVLWIAIVLSGIRRDGPWQWVGVAITILGALPTCAIIYPYALGSVLYSRVFVSATPYRAAVDDGILRLATLGSGEFPSRGYAVLHCTFAGYWCRQVGAVDAGAIGGEWPPASVRLSEANHVVHLELNNQVVATYADGEWVCAPALIEGCR